MYRVWWPTHSCHQIASECTKSHTEFQKVFRGWYPRTLVSAGLHPHTPVPDWESEKVATLVPTVSLSLPNWSLSVLELKIIFLSVLEHMLAIIWKERIISLFIFLSYGKSLNVSVCLCFGSDKKQNWQHWFEANALSVSVLSILLQSPSLSWLPWFLLWCRRSKFGLAVRNSMVQVQESAHHAMYWQWWPGIITCKCCIVLSCKGVIYLGAVYFNKPIFDCTLIVLSCKGVIYLGAVYFNKPIFDCTSVSLGSVATYARCGGT